MKRVLRSQLALMLVAMVMIVAAIVVPLGSSHVHAQAPAGSWTTTGSMNTSRFQHTATLLPNGKVLVAGGFDQFTCGCVLSSAELYDPSTGTWTPTGSMNQVRSRHTATLLPNGKVLVAGGSINSLSAELYDLSTGTWTPTGNMNTGHSDHTATLLPNGKVLVAGGNGSSAELYDPSAGTWTPTGSMNTARGSQQAALLPNGQVLVAGGYNNTSGGWLASAELYDPSTGTWTPTGSMNAARTDHTATLLPNGKVLVAGGHNDVSGDSGLASAELYDPSTGTWTPTGSMNTAHANHTATLLPNGQVLVAGGSFNSLAAELYDPSTGTWTPTGSMNTAHFYHTATLLPNGQVLVAGGILASAELFSGGAAADTTPPVLSLPGTITADATSPAGAVVTYSVSATDPDNQPSQLVINCSPASGSTFPIGTTTVHCTASDPAGNSATGSFQVVVKDVTPPTLSLPNTITVNATSPQGATASYTVTATDSDNPASDLTIKCSPASGSTFAIGTTTVNCTASDPSGNSSSSSFQVVVKGAVGQISDLSNQVDSFHLASGLQTSLDAKLQAVLSAVNAGQTATACSDLTDFIGQVQSQSGKKLTVSQANQLIAAAKQIQAVLGC